MENIELILYKIEEIKEDISNIKKDVKTISVNGCFVGTVNKTDIVLIKENITRLEKRPRENVVFVGICLMLFLTVGSILLYLHSSLPIENLSAITNIIP